MPFKSRAQLRTCYGRKGGFGKGIKGCDEWLKKTKLSLECLPEKAGDGPKCRRIKGGERIRSKLMEGPRGGKYFIITEGKYKVKVYVPR